MKERDERYYSYPLPTGLIITHTIMTIIGYFGIIVGGYFVRLAGLSEDLFKWVLDAVIVLVGAIALLFLYAFVTSILRNPPIYRGRGFKSLKTIITILSVVLSVVSVIVIVILNGSINFYFLLVFIFATAYVFILNLGSNNLTGYCSCCGLCNTFRVETVQQTNLGVGTEYKEWEEGFKRYYDVGTYHYQEQDVTYVCKVCGNRTKKKSVNKTRLDG